MAGGLVLHRLGDRSLWYDEAVTVGTIDRPFGDALWRITHWELDQSPYSLLLSGWHRLGEGESFLRLLSALFAVLTVPVVFALGRRLVDAWTGAIAAAVVAVNSLVVEWGQQVRGYSSALFVVSLFALSLVGALEQRSRIRNIAVGVVAAVAAYSHLVAGLTVVVIGASLLLVRPVPGKLLRQAAVTAGILVLPLVWFLVRGAGDPLTWIGEPSGRELVDVLADLTGGGLRHLAVLGGLAAVGAFFAGRTGLRRRWWTLDVWRSMLPVVWLVVPVLVVVVSTYTVKPLLVARFLLVVVPALALLVGAGVRRLPKPGVVVALVALAAVSVQGVQTWYSVGSFENWRGAVASIERSAEPGDVVVVIPNRAVQAVRYYGPDLDLLPVRRLRRDAGRARVWVVDRLSQVGPERTVPRWFDDVMAQRYEVVDERSFTNLAVTLYERR